MPRDRPVCGGHGRQNKPKWVPQGSALAEEVGPLPINQQLSEKSTKCMMLMNKDGCHSHRVLGTSLVMPNSFLLAGLVSTKGHCEEKPLGSAGNNGEVDNRGSHNAGGKSGVGLISQRLAGTAGPCMTWLGQVISCL